MVRMIDTEGAFIPADGFNEQPMFDVDLCDYGDGTGPALTINVPDYFEVPGGIYDSCGVVHVPLQAVLMQYLQEFMHEDGGEHIEEFASWLHNYADKLISAKKNEGKGGGTC